MCRGIYMVAEEVRWWSLAGQGVGSRITNKIVADPNSNSLGLKENSLARENVRLKKRLKALLYFYSRAFNTGLPFNTECFSKITETINARRADDGNVLDGALFIMRLVEIARIVPGRHEYLVFLHRVVQLIQNTMDVELFQSDQINEFMLFLPNVKSVREAQAISSELHRIVVPGALKNDRVLLACRMRVGVSLLTRTVVTAEAFVKQAFYALYDAIKKQEPLTVYEEAIGVRHERQRSIERALMEEMGKSTMGFSFRAQPIMSYRSHLYGAELLLRWHHPVLGHVSPSEFIPIAEETGLSIMLDKWVIREAIKHYKVMDAYLSHKLFLFVNISPQSLLQKDFADQVKEMFIDDSDLCKYFMFEITERVSLVDIEMVGKNITSITDLGIKIALDDFGAGFCAFSNILELPISIIKIDRMLAQSISTDKGRQALLKTLLTLRKNANVKILIEGVEEFNQISYIQKFSYDYCQGYFYAKPLSIDGFITFAREIIMSTDYYYKLLSCSP